MFSTTPIITVLALLRLASAECQLTNGIEPNAPPTEHPELCVPTGQGTFTFASEDSDIVVPTFDADNPYAGHVGHTYFYIFDESCRPLARYVQPDCGTPYVAKENFLTQVLTVTNINFASGRGYWSFDYGAGKYSINNNQCGCQDMSSGLRGTSGCKCAFPVSGFGKRDVNGTLVV